MASATAAMSDHGLYKVTEYDALDRVTREYYARFNASAETMRSQMSVEGGRLPGHSIVRQTRTAEYYPFDGSRFNPMSSLLSVPQYGRPYLEHRQVHRNQHESDDDADEDNHHGFEPGLDFLEAGL